MQGDWKPISELPVELYYSSVFIGKGDTVWLATQPYFYLKVNDADQLFYQEIKYPNPPTK